MQIKFKTFGANSLFGGFAPGDTMRCADDLARHLVEELQVADYAEVKVAPVVVEQAPKKRGKKE